MKQLLIVSIFMGLLFPSLTVAQSDSIPTINFDNLAAEAQKQTDEESTLNKYQTYLSVTAEKQKETQHLFGQAERKEQEILEEMGVIKDEMLKTYPRDAENYLTPYRDAVAITDTELTPLEVAYTIKERNNEGFDQHQLEKVDSMVAEVRYSLGLLEAQQIRNNRLLEKKQALLSAQVRLSRDYQIDKVRLDGLRKVINTRQERFESLVALEDRYWDQIDATWTGIRRVVRHPSQRIQSPFDEAERLHDSSLNYNVSDTINLPSESSTVVLQINEEEYQQLIEDYREVKAKIEAQLERNATFKGLLNELQESLQQAENGTALANTRIDQLNGEIDDEERLIEQLNDSLQLISEWYRTHEAEVKRTFGISVNGSFSQHSSADVQQLGPLFSRAKKAEDQEFTPQYDAVTIDNEFIKEQLRHQLQQTENEYRRIHSARKQMELFYQQLRKTAEGLASVARLPLPIK